MRLINVHIIIEAKIMELRLVYRCHQSVSGGAKVRNQW